MQSIKIVKYSMQMNQICAEFQNFGNMLHELQPAKTLKL